MRRSSVSWRGSSRIIPNAAEMRLSGFEIGSGMALGTRRERLKQRGAKPRRVLKFLDILCAAAPGAPFRMPENHLGGRKTMSSGSSVVPSSAWRIFRKAFVRFRNRFWDGSEDTASARPCSKCGRRTVIWEVFAAFVQARCALRNLLILRPVHHLNGIWRALKC